MDGQKRDPDVRRLNKEARRIWDRNAEWWDDRIGDGNDFQRRLIEPATEDLVEISSGTTVLDIACGAGRFARRMAEMGAKVVAFDFSDRFIARARQRTPPDLTQVEYLVLDATDREALLRLGSSRFNGAVATMALMDMADIRPLFSTLPVLLRPGGWFVFSIMHPCFQSHGIYKFAEAVEEDGVSAVRTGVKVSRYITPATWRGEGIVGQPERQYYFHRPLSLIFQAGFANGFVVDGLVEPTFAGAADDERHLRWDHMPEIPPVLVVRMRLRVTE
ncbi:MAG: class I SAM-dependent methyltransferase [Candidatus Brocadiaceae bacterium]|jgi:2-polyprenyl-3-methyl-5-hydroxy-6-metoxy-1,4-benzoquinol methylase